MTSIIALYPIITMHTLNEKGVVGIIISISDIFSGLVVPIPFFPKFLQTISKCMPFQYVSDLPFRLYVGNIGINSGIKMIIIQVVWLIILIVVGYLLIKKNLKRVEVQGG